MTEKTGQFTLVAEPTDGAAQETSQTITEADLDAATVAGALAERERVTAILQAGEAKPHAVAAAHAAIVSGLSAEQAQAMLNAVPEPATLESIEDGARAKFRQGFLAEAQEPAPSVDSATGDAPVDDGGDPTAAAKAAWDANASLRAEFGNSFERYQAFTKATASGRVKILRQARADALHSSAG